jgi:hypothetical protein
MAARERKNMRYVIRCTTESDAGCFWSNQHGWTSLDEATKFTPPEKETLNLPIGGEWAADNASPQIMDETEQRVAVGVNVPGVLRELLAANDLVEQMEDVLRKLEHAASMVELADNSGNNPQAVQLREALTLARKFTERQ